MTYRKVLFDLDGTLTDSGPGIMNAVSYALECFGLREEPESLRRYVGPPLTAAFQEFRGMDRQQAEQAVLKFRDYYKERGWAENAPYPGIQGLLGDLKAAGIESIVATSKPIDQASNILDYFDLSPYFTDVCAPVPGSMYHTKTDVIRSALEKTGTCDVIMIGDRMHDVEGAHANGIPAAGVLYGYGSREELEAAGADFLLESVEQLHRFLLEDHK